MKTKNQFSALSVFAHQLKLQFYLNIKKKKFKKIPFN